MAKRLLFFFQQGAALIILMVLLVLGALAGLTYVMTSLTPHAIEARRAEQTAVALRAAREALLGHALTHRERQAAQDTNSSGADDAALYGFLPLPDRGESLSRNADLDPDPPCVGEGCAMVNSNFVPTGDTLVVGRFPWKFLGTAPLRDGQGECLWYAVAATHREVNATVATMNWDTLASPDILLGSGLSDFTATAAHDRPLAVIFSPDPAFDNGRTPNPETAECGGNYDHAHYLNPAAGNAQKAMPITSSTLFDAIRKNRFFRNDLKEMLQRMARCWSRNLADLTPLALDGYTAPADKLAGRIPDAPTACNDFPDTAYGDTADPKGYFRSYRDMVFIARPSLASDRFTVNGVTDCTGVLVFSGPRGSGQQRASTTDTARPANYLESTNLASFTGTGREFSGDSPQSDFAPQASGTDIVLCIPAATAEPPILAEAPANATA